ncbi:MAG: response regulator [Gammaproteobacteria bacterium]
MTSAGIENQILICTSSEIKGQHLSEKFRKAAAGSSIAYTTSQAINLLEEQPIIAVVVDLMMNDCDGISFALQLKEDLPWLPVIVMTTDQLETGASQSDWLTRNRVHTQLEFSLRHASLNQKTRSAQILHLEMNDETASLVQNTLGTTTEVFRARSLQEANIAMALRQYDLALISSDYTATTSDRASESADTASHLLSILGNFNNRSWLAAESASS